MCIEEKVDQEALPEVGFLVILREAENLEVEDLREWKAPFPHSFYLCNSAFTTIINSDETFAAAAVALKSS
nr:hypothetical protein Iba_chr06cCG16150 [Ipomoea batatas]GMD08385.1 hypothetical protein Iba_chr06cCG16160 [Ipomoea batatas]